MAKIPIPKATQRSAYGSVQRRHERVRQRVFAEASRLFEENGGEAGRGFEDTTVEQIAERAEISVRTFFRMFESKTDVIYLDMRRSMDEYFACLEETLQTHADPMAAALLARLDQISAFAAVPDNRTRLMRSLKSRHFVNRRATWYTLWQGQLQNVLLPYLPRRKDSALRAALIAAMVVKIGELGLQHWEQGGGADDPARAIAEVYLLLDGVLAPTREAITAYLQASPRRKPAARRAAAA
jgi:AcrR family transcriptional regulator